MASLDSTVSSLSLSFLSEDDQNFDRIVLSLLENENTGYVQVKQALQKQLERPLTATERARISTSVTSAIDHTLRDTNLDSGATKSPIVDTAATCEHCPKRRCNRWDRAEDELLKSAVLQYGARNWKSIAHMVPGRTHAQCLQRWAKALQPGLRKGHWTQAEDELLKQVVSRHGCSLLNWQTIAQQVPGRTTKQCRERWFHHLDPSINRAPWSQEEDLLILSQQQKLGSKWALIARMLTHRTSEMVKIRHKTLMRRQHDEVQKHGGLFL